MFQVVSQCCKPPGLKSDILGGNYLLLRAATSRFIAYLVQSLLVYNIIIFLELQAFFTPQKAIQTILQFRRFQQPTFVHHVQEQVHIMEFTAMEEVFYPLLLVTFLCFHSLF